MMRVKRTVRTLFIIISEKYNWQSPVALLQMVVSDAKYLGCYSIPMTGIAMLQTLMLGI